MEQSQVSYAFEGYQFKLSKAGDRLLIEIEAESTGKSFSLELDNDVILQASNELFSDVNTLYQGLEEALTKTHPEVVMTFDGKEILTYRVSFSIGILKKNLQFSLSFQEKKLDQVSVLERKMDNRFSQLINKISEIERIMDIKSGNNHVLERFGQNDANRQAFPQELLEKQIMSFEAKMNGLEKKLFDKLEAIEDKIARQEAESKKYIDLHINQTMSSLEERILHKLQNQPKNINNPPEPVIEKDLTFDPSSHKARHFTLTNNNKTAELVGESTDECLPLMNTLPSSGQFKVSLKIENMKSHIYLGLIMDDKVKQSKWYSCSLYYFTLNGYIYDRITSTSEIKTKNSDIGFGKVGDVITLNVNIDEGLICFAVNGVEVNSINRDLKGKTYFCFCGFDKKGTIATIV